MRYRLDIAVGGKLCQRSGNRPFSGKLPGMADHIADLGLRKPDLTHESLKAAFTKICEKRLLNIIFIFFYGSIELF